MDAKQKAIDFVLKWEGGFIDDPRDPGGATKYGISFRFLRDKNIDINLDGDIDSNDVLSLTKEQAIKLYEKHFWVEYDDPKKNIVLFDTKVNCGAVTAFKLWDLAKSIDDFFILRIEYYCNLCNNNKKLNKFLLGWINRVLALREVIYDHC